MNQLESLIKINIVHCIYNTEIPYSFDSKKIFQILTKYKAQFIVSPGVFAKSKWIKTTPKNYFNYKIKQLLGGRFFHLKNTFIKKIFSLTSPSFWKINKANYTYLIGKYAYENRKSHKLIGNNTKVIWGHSRTYDEYLDFKKKRLVKKIKKRKVLFIDQGVPFHPDTTLLGLHSIKAKEYYSSINKYLEKIKKKLNYQVSVACHPKINPKKIKKYFSNFSVTFGNTIFQVMNSDLVILHDSTAMNYAVMFGKPIIFVTNNSLKNGIIPYNEIIKSKAKLLNKGYVNIDVDNEINIAKYFDIDKKAYKKYSDNFIKFKGLKDYQSNVIYKKLKNDKLWI